MVNVKPYHILVVQVVSTTVCTILVVWIPPWSVAHDSLAKENYVAIITSVLHLVCVLLKTTLFCQTRSSLKYSVAQSVRHRCRLLSVDDHSFYVHRTKKGATDDVQLDPVLLPDLDHRLQRQLVLLPVAGVARVRAVAHDHQPARLHIL